MDLGRKRRFAWTALISLSVGSLILSVASCGCHKDLPLEINGKTRYYRLHIPAGYTGDTAVPLLLALHQFSDTAAGTEKLTGFNAIADREGFLVAYPQGRWRRWQLDKAEDLNFLLALIDHIAAGYSVDRARIYAAGPSAGGMMCHILACRSDRFAAIAPVMGPITKAAADSCSAGPPIPVLMIHGTNDPVVPYVENLSDSPFYDSFLGAEECAAWWAARNGCRDAPVRSPLPPVQQSDPTSVTCLRYDCAPGQEVLLYSVAGGGHTWPGHKNRYPAFIVGPTSMQMDASEVIWDFLKQHRKTALPPAR